MPSARASGRRASTNTQASAPTSGREPSRLHRTGTSCCIASSSGMPKPSCSEGNTSAPAVSHSLPNRSGGT